jgi:integrase
MLKATPTRRKGSRQYEVRVRVPAQFRAQLGISGTHTTRSLKTTSYSEAVRRTGEVLRALEAKAGATRQSAATPGAFAAEGQPLPNTPELCRMYRRWRRREIADLRADIRDLFHDGHMSLSNGELIALPPQRDVRDFASKPRKLLAEAHRSAIKRWLAEAEDCAVTGEEFDLRGFTMHLEFDLRIEGKPSEEASRALLLTEIEVLREILADDALLLRSDVLATADIVASTQTAKLSEVMESYLAGQTRLTVAYVEAIRAAVREFIELCGDKPVSDYRRTDAAVFRDTLLLLPANWRKKRELKTLDIRQAAQRSKELGTPRQKAKTIREKWFKLFTIYEFARSTSDGVVQLFESKSLHVSDRLAHNEQKTPFSPDELRALFTNPLPGNLHWLAWLGLYVGARLNELCQLTTAHVKCHQGIWYIHFSKELQLKTGETESCVRSVPICPDLVQAGFLEFAATSNGPFFPSLKKNKKTGRLSDIPSKRFSQHLKRLGLKRSRLSFHSLRHTFAVALKRVPACDVETRERLLGHAVGGMAQRYGGSYEAEAEDFELLRKRAKVLEKMRFDGLLQTVAAAGSGDQTADELTHRPG